MVVLCYTEVLVPGSSDWRLHLRGCRTILDLQPLKECFLASDDPVINFLLKEICDLEMITGISTFHHESAPLQLTAVHPSRTDAGWAFTKLIHSVTELERERYRQWQAGASPPSVDMSIWCQRAQEAHVKSLACTEWLDGGHQSSLRPSFEAVVRAHHSATIIYAYQAFKTPGEKDAALPGLLDPLLTDIRFVLAGPTDDLFHDLFFPLFIAGIEYASDPEKTCEIDRLYLQSLTRTGVWCNYSALQFLRNFWSACLVSPEPLNWMEFARANTSAFETFVVF
jgi:hypothetical protein